MTNAQTLSLDNLNANLLEGLRQVWEDAPLGDGLLAMCYEIGVPEELLIQAQLDVVEPLLQYLPWSETRPQKFFEVARKGTYGDPEWLQAREAAAEAFLDAPDTTEWPRFMHKVMLAAYHAASPYTRTCCADASSAVYDLHPEEDKAQEFADGYAALMVQMVRARIPWEVVEECYKRQLPG